MIPKSNLYQDTTVDSMKTMMDISKLLEKFEITEKRLTQSGSNGSFFEFIIKKDKTVNLLIKIKIPQIEKRTKNGIIYDESRSYRYFYHYLKALLSAKEAEMYSLEEIFMAHIVMPLPDGSTITLGEQMVQSLSSGNAPMLEGFNVVSAPITNALENHKNRILKKND